MNDIVETAGVILGMLSAAGLVGGGVWLHRKENKRLKQAEAAKAEADLNTMAAQEWKQIAENRELKLQDASRQIKEKDTQITALFDKIGEERIKRNEAENKSHLMEVERIREQIRLCEVKKCPNRIPQTGF